MLHREIIGDNNDIVTLFLVNIIHIANYDQYFLTTQKKRFSQ